MFDPSSPYAGKISAYDSPIYIADAALVLMQTEPDLKITNPYALDQKQFDAAVELLKGQRKVVGEYWSDYAAQQQAFEKGDDVLGTSWQVIVNLIEADKKPVEASVPAEGATGWSDTWMVNAKSQHPNCAYAWLDYIGGPDGNAESAYYFGELRPTPRRATPSRRSTTTRRSATRSTPTTRPTPRRSGTGPRRSRTASTVVT